jgi:hypothetical protein
MGIIQMKNTMYLALIILAAFPASAQKAAIPNRPVNADEVIASSADYAARVGRLLREVHLSLQKISSRMEAGELTPEQARDLKLAATRDVISRLDSLAAIYDVRLEARPRTAVTVEASGPNRSVADGRSAAIAKTNSTVSVEQLKREEAAAAAEPRTEQTSR